MRIRSVLAATVLAAALAATGATTASAAGHDDMGDNNDYPVCSPYAGELSSSVNHAAWSGVHCSDYLR
ncbi:hypothetical protein NX794_29180 [Streptomyces sp. LP11]|uniref:Secreted protein n=1 Tax=Streptomyces pyxinicus TaxID=2970331 RepID=A0ABT2BBE8_9ACTN|nr:hypothetical protein [Streptomyces sp. LP11]MCS0605253.1 hypothetical protein [Streptomyces sp. LP11]